MNYFLLISLLLFFESNIILGNPLTKLKGESPPDIHEIQEDKLSNAIWFVDPKPQKPLLREIVYYHLLEEPYGNDPENELNTTEQLKNFIKRYKYELIEPTPGDDISRSTINDASEDGATVEYVIENKDKDDKPPTNRKKREIYDIPEAPKLPELDYSTLPEYIRKAVSTEKQKRHNPSDFVKSLDINHNNNDIINEEDEAKRIIRDKIEEIFENLKPHTKKFGEDTKISDGHGNKSKDIEKNNKPRTYGMKLTSDHGYVWNDLWSNPGMYYEVGKTENEDNNSVEGEKDNEYNESSVEKPISDKSSEDSKEGLGELDDRFTETHKFLKENDKNKDSNEENERKPAKKTKEASSEVDNSAIVQNKEPKKDSEEYEKESDKQEEFDKNNKDDKTFNEHGEHEIYPDENGRYPDKNGRYPDEYGRYPDKNGRYPNNNGKYSDETEDYKKELIYNKKPEDDKYGDKYGRYANKHEVYVNKNGKYPKKDKDGQKYPDKDGEEEEPHKKQNTPQKKYKKEDEDNTSYESREERAQKHHRYTEDENKFDNHKKYPKLDIRFNKYESSSSEYKKEQEPHIGHSKKVAGENRNRYYEDQKKEAEKHNNYPKKTDENYEITEKYEIETGITPTHSEHDDKPKKPNKYIEKNEKVFEIPNSFDKEQDYKIRDGSYNAEKHEESPIYDKYDKDRNHVNGPKKPEHISENINNKYYKKHDIEDPSELDKEPKKYVENNEKELKKNKEIQINDRFDETYKKTDMWDDIMHNDHFWKWMSDWTAAYTDLLTEYIAKQVKDEVAKQMEKYYENMKANENKIITEKIFEEQHKETDDDENYEGTHNNNNNNNEKEVKETSHGQAIIENDKFILDDKEIPLTHKTNFKDDFTKGNYDYLTKIHNKIPNDNKNNKYDVPIKVDVENIYGNTVGSDKVTNVFVFYPNKEVNNVFEDIKPIVNATGTDDNDVDIDVRFNDEKKGDEDRKIITDGI